MSSLPCKSSNAAWLMPLTSASLLPPMVGHSLRGSGSVLACSSSSSAGEMVILSHLRQNRRYTQYKGHRK
jgi:hypothetical protein